MRHTCFAIAVACMVSVAQAQTTRPPTFTVTAGANTKELLFDWDPVPGAVIYRLLWKTREGQYFEPYDETRLRRSRVAIPIAAHLQPWQFMRFVVLACNPAGCTRSNEIAGIDHMLDAIGYFKASNTDPQDRFGDAIAMSADGTTLAVAAPGEDGSSDGSEVDPGNPSMNTGAVYVYRRQGRRWTQEAYLKGYYSQPGSAVGGAGVTSVKGRTLSLNVDGSVLAVGAPSFDLTAGGNEGAVYLFTRDAGNVWKFAQHLVSPATFFRGDNFGYTLDLSSDGNTLMVNSAGARDSSGYAVGHTHLYARTGNAWLRSTTLTPPYADDICPMTRMSANGRVLVSSCGFTSSHPGARAVTRRLVGGSWVRYPDLPINWRGPQPIAIDYAGSKLAINYSAWTYGDFGIGIYRWENNRWVAEVAVREPTWYPATSGTWGSALEFDRLGAFLAIGDPRCTAHGAGVMPPVMGTEPHGCVYFYERFFPQEGAAPNWRERSRIKAPSPATGDEFGSSIALGGSAWYLAVGAPGEDSDARGVDGDQASDAAEEAGAVYLY
jgi:hypothetical protein